MGGKEDSEYKDNSQLSFDNFTNSKSPENSATWEIDKNDPTKIIITIDRTKNTYDNGRVINDGKEQYTFKFQENDNDYTLTCENVAILVPEESHQTTPRITTYTQDGALKRQGHIYNLKKQVKKDSEFRITLKSDHTGTTGNANSNSAKEITWKMYGNNPNTIEYGQVNSPGNENHLTYIPDENILVNGKSDKDYKTYYEKE